MFPDNSVSNGDEKKRCCSKDNVIEVSVYALEEKELWIMLL